MIRCRHGRDRLACTVCLPAITHAIPITRYSPRTDSVLVTLQPKGALRGTPLRERRRRIPHHLFVCQDCYKAFRAGSAINPKHEACRDRLKQRVEDMPLSGAVAG